MFKLFSPEHFKQCADIFFQLYKNEPFNYSWLTYSSVCNYFSDLLNTPKFYGFVIEQNGVIIGACFGIFSDYFKIKKYRISEIFIDKKYQGKGFGTELLSKVEEYFKRAGALVVEISTDKETPAFEFYKKNSYNLISANVNMIKIL